MAARHVKTNRPKLQRAHKKTKKIVMQESPRDAAEGDRAAIEEALAHQEESKSSK